MMRRNAPPLRVAALLAIGLFLVCGNSVDAQESAVVPRASAVVKPRAYVSLEPVPQGKEFLIAVVVEIARGYHMNSHHPSDAYLIPTALTPQLPAGFQLLDTIYPDGHPQKFSFSPDKPLDVYSGSVTVKLKLLEQTSAPLGAITIPMTLRYQACNDSTCLPPVKLPVEAQLVVGASDAKAHTMHPDVFSSVFLEINPEVYLSRVAPDVRMASVRMAMDQRAARNSSARLRRAITRSLDSATIVSNRGGATARPTSATRVALISTPAFTPASPATARDAASQASWFQSGSAASASASLASSPGIFSSFQNLSQAS
jgi:DsbC/DsbD-like thiol-disulfide interchange protein